MDLSLKYIWLGKNRNIVGINYIPALCLKLPSCLISCFLDSSPRLVDIIAAVPSQYKKVATF